MNLCVRPRALLLFAVLSVGLLAVGDASAQDPRATEAQAAAREWLALADKGDVNGSLQAGGKKFREALDADSWGEALTKVRTPLGEVTNRTVIATRFQTTFPGHPDGEYALLLFDTTFTKKGQSRETVTLERETDGKWRVIGYFIR